MCPFHMITISTYIIETHFDVIFTLIIIKFIESETRIQDVRPHVGLNGMTSEKCGIKIQGKDKWKKLIQTASKKNLISKGMPY
jgi:hypothetical protein